MKKKQKDPSRWIILLLRKNLQEKKVQACALLDIVNSSTCLSAHVLLQVKKKTKIFMDEQYTQLCRGTYYLFKELQRKSVNYKIKHIF